MRATVYTFALGVLIAAVKADELTDLVVNEMKKCMNSEKLDSVGGLSADTVPTTSEQKCFVGCMLKLFHALNAEGHYDKAGLNTVINHCPRMKDRPDKRAAASAVAEECEAKVSGCNDYCSCAPVVLKCLSEGIKSKGFETIFVPLQEAYDAMTA